MEGRRRFALVGLAWMLSGCGYTMVKRNKLEDHRLPADSVRIAMLEAQLGQMRRQREIDSLKCAKLAEQPPPPAPQPAAAAAADTLLKAKDFEIQTLRDQVAKLQAEIDRIKRRLANPKN